MADRAFITTDATHVFPRELDRSYPLIVKAEGVRLWDSAGNEYLDAISGGAMVTCLGHGVEDAAREFGGHLFPDDAPRRRDMVIKLVSWE